MQNAKALTSSLQLPGILIDHTLYFKIKQSTIWLCMQLGDTPPTVISCMDMDNYAPTHTLLYRN